MKLGNNMFKNSATKIGLVRRGVSFLMGLSGLLSIYSSTHLRALPVNNPFVGPNTAWLAQHAIAVGFAFLYLARKIYQGESTAYKISLVLIFMQVVKYCIVSPHPVLFVIYSFTLVTMLLSSRYFDRRSNSQSFIYRFKTVIAAVVVSATIISLYGIITNLREPQIWQNGAYNASRIVMRVTLLEVSDDVQDSIPERLFGQVLTAAGIATYAWVLAGLFLPSIHRRGYADEIERQTMLDIVNLYGINSEDSLKLWPQDKHYWFGSGNKAGIAYKQYKSFVFALSSPVGLESDISKVAEDFKKYCREHGWKLVWLLCNGNANKAYEESGLKTLTIGASAVVDLDKYSEITVRSKYWRWIRNKNSKLELNYDTLTPPHSRSVIEQVQAVSNSWLEREGREERTFALGYFDEDFVRSCVLHVLRDSTGNIVAFTNQLPTYNYCSQATIDMMRCLPEYDGAMAYLLSELLLKLKVDANYSSFDLGFVPLAHTADKLTKKAVLGLSKTLMENFFSARGLRQFKNKFEPEWHDNYIAWDGDLLDLPAIAQSLDKVLKLKINI